MNNHGLQYYMHDGPAAFRFQLAGELNHEGARRLDQDWRTASSTIGDRDQVVDITFLTRLDEQGALLLARWHRQGARIIANSDTSRALAESVLGEMVLASPPARRADRATGRPWWPFRVSSPTSVNVVLLLASLVFPVQAIAANLKAETVDAWDDYLRTASANFQERVHPGGSYLWSLENAERAGKVRAGEIVVESASGQHPRKVPGGLIHHWIGAALLPNLNLKDILEVTRDYDRYKDFYRPSVIESRAVARNGSTDRFSMLLMNKVLFSKIALDADYEATNVILDDRRFYRVCWTTRVQEIDSYGQPDEHKSAEGQGGGYVWKLYSIARFEQRDEGVYVELEAMALSRDIPAALHLLADPIVRRVSRNSMVLSLQQTGEAVRYVARARQDHVPVTAERMGGLPEILSNTTSAFTRVH